ncbi:Por secretion system C-terminal sorting domain-containing protein [Dyadobacter sp. SG02]|uniref:CshA/CshB family fibrillar adhesin-related protein n=1 Tax=Dyadobacter sp. SG02 TaxID=1855291 RepID=UPI0008B5C539|nr:CshA/CshB family fibrillar adhesin-related protein [Dyadobacter sp. SG02]SEJ37959.1 Por secretion system C-terminal sorting domain-containing protein [Dyadobacter sp. SG02]
MKKLLLGFLTGGIMSFAQVAHAQYADGTGTGIHQNKIFWLAWGGPSLTSFPAGFTSTNIVAGTYIWDLEPGFVRVVGQMSNIERPVLPTSGTLTVAPYTSGTYVGNGTSSLGDGLQLMYPGVNPIGMATYISPDPGSYKGGVIEFDIDLKLQMQINGVWTDLNYPGMVIADAESMASDNVGTEYISAKTNGTTGWQILDVRNDAASIGQNPNNYKLEIGDGGKFFKLYNNLVRNMGVQAVMYAQGTKTLADVQMQGQGRTALALGFVAPFDYGDAPESYGEAIHYIDDLVLNGTPITTDGVYSVASQTAASLITPTANVYINLLPDADGGLNHFSPTADVDGATTVPDYDGSGTYTLTIPITNNTGQPTNLGGWIDWNQNGLFDPSEAVLETLPASATTATFTWTGLSTHPNPLKPFFVRVRVSTDTILNPNSGATNGEVEDYALWATATISGNVFQDANGLSNGTVDGNGTNLSNVLYVNLVDNLGNVVDSAPVGSDGRYAFGGQLVGDYNLHLTSQAGIPGTPATGSSLPANFVATGENLGAGAGSDGIINQILPVTLTAGQILSEANFAVQQPPVSDSYSFDIPTPALNSLLPLNGTGAADSPGPLSATDPEDGQLTTGKILIISDLSGMNGNELYYNGIALADGDTIAHYDPALLQLKFTSIGSTSLGFAYNFLDNASSAGTAGNYVVRWMKPLPVTLIGFTATREGATVDLRWQTTSETNSARFEVYRSYNAKNWQKIGTVSAASQSTELTNYQLTDSAPFSGVNYYRLKIIDADESFAFSHLSQVRTYSSVTLGVYPNPTSDFLQVSLPDGGEIKRLVLTNSSGTTVKVTAGDTISIRDFADGVYILQVLTRQGEWARSTILIRH